MRFSVIIPVYNRPEEIRELLQSLTEQTTQNFEVIIVEDGSSSKCDDIVRSFSGKLKVHYFYKPNSGPGATRNFGMEKASEDFFIFFDSDCIIPPTYFEILTRTYEIQYFDCFGGVDRSHTSFTPVQKAIDYSMTSFLTTGGIRGGGRKVTKFYPRSFNMGFSRKVYEVTGGYARMRFGEDIDLSLRIEKAGFTLALLNEAFVYHKRRTDFRKFFRQIFNSGMARIHLYQLYPRSLKITHLFPLFFVFFVLISIAAAVCIHLFLLLPLCFYLFLIFIHAAISRQSLKVGFLSVISTITQMFAYGLGFLKAVWKRLVLRKEDALPEEALSTFNKKFYK